MPPNPTPTDAGPIKLPVELKHIDDECYMIDVDGHFVTGFASTEHAAGRQIVAALNATARRVMEMSEMTLSMQDAGARTLARCFARRPKDGSSIDFREWAAKCWIAMEIQKDNDQPLSAKGETG